MRRTISVKREHPTDAMIKDDSTATEKNSMSATRSKYYRLLKSSAAIDAEQWFKMVEHRSLAENEPVQVASQANALPPLKEKDVTLVAGDLVFYSRRNRDRPVGEWSEGQGSPLVFL